MCKVCVLRIMRAWCKKIKDDLINEDIHHVHGWEEKKKAKHSSLFFFNGQHLNGQFTKEAMWLANKPMERCLTFWTIGKCKLKFKWDTIVNLLQWLKSSSNKPHSQDAEHSKLLCIIITSENAKWDGHMGKQCAGWLNEYLLYDAVILASIYLRS